MNRLAKQVEGEIERASRRQYRLNLDNLDDLTLQELRRFVRDMEYEKQVAINRLRRNPWSR